ncbi:hypothetical protein [Streptomyces globisporus]|uniref:hypothetical protein n=1 Tax=Streptomyces globisporus TaxID=1908 RepID=UPI002F9086A3|nr:hypothetical protein OG425_34925 [Streptomyces globisporus]WSV94682.1 hypothetical protein OG449_35750 [Streptomyces globisporus]
MTTPVPEERAAEAFTESAQEAVQTAVMAARLVMAIADAARRHQQRKHTGEEEDHPATEKAVKEVGGNVERLLPSDISAALMGEAEWPQLAQQLLALREAGVDLEQILPHIGEVAVNVRDQVAAKASEAATDEWTRVVRETLPAGSLREGILNSPTWPEIAATMARLDAKGVNVREVLATAYDTVQGVDQTVAKTVGAPAARMTKDAQLLYGPLSVGLDLPADFDPSNHEQALIQLGISQGENEHYARLVREAIPGHGQEANRLLASPRWPFVLARMAQTENDGTPVATRLAGLTKDTSWTEGPSSQVTARLALAATDALRGPRHEGPGRETRVRVDATAARSTSPSVSPTRAPTKAVAPTSPGGAAHRKPGPAPARGKAL